MDEPTSVGKLVHKLVQKLVHACAAAAAPGPDFRRGQPRLIMSTGEAALPRTSTVDLADLEIMSKCLEAAQERQRLEAALKQSTKGSKKGSQIVDDRRAMATRARLHGKLQAAAATTVGAQAAKGASIAPLSNVITHGAVAGAEMTSNLEEDGACALVPAIYCAAREMCYA